MWPLAMKRSETLTLDTVLSRFNSLHSRTTYCFVAIFVIYQQSIPKSPNLSFRIFCLAVCIFPYLLLFVLGLNNLYSSVVTFRTVMYCSGEWFLVQPKQWVWTPSRVVCARLLLSTLQELHFGCTYSRLHFCKATFRLHLQSTTLL
jgi:hypothetical protein